MARAFKTLIPLLPIICFALACTTSPKKSASSREDLLTRSAEEKEKTVTDPEFLRAQADYHFTLGEAYGLEGDVNRAVEEYKLTLVYDPQSAEVRMKLSAELVKKGQLVQAIDQAETAVQMKPDYTDARLLLGGLYSSNKLYEKATEQYQAVMTTDPDNIEAALYIGAILAEQKKFAESVAHFKKTAQGKKQLHLVYYYLGRVELEQKHEKEAEESFKKSALAKPEFVETTLALGFLYEQQKKVDLALKTYRTYQEKYGPSVKMATNLARIYMETDRYSEAYKQYELIEEEDSENLNIKVKMALILIEQKKYEVAIVKLKNILAVAPESEKIRFYLAAVYEELKDSPEAIEQFQQIKPESTLYGESVVHTAYLQKLQNNITGSLETMSKALSNRTDIAQFYSFYASLLDEHHELQTAVSILSEGVKKFPKDEQLYFYLGSMQDKSGLKDQSIASMRKVLELNPEHIQALNYLGYSLAEMNSNLSEAELFVRRALKLKPNDGYITDSLGWVLFRRGQFKEAIALLEAAYKIKPNESVIAEHLGDAYLRYSLRDKARQMYIRAVTLESDATTIDKIKQKISELDSPRSEDSRGPASDSSPKL